MSLQSCSEDKLPRTSLLPWPCAPKFPWPSLAICLRATGDSLAHSGGLHRPGPPRGLEGFIVLCSSRDSGEDATLQVLDYRSHMCNIRTDIEPTWGVLTFYSPREHVVSRCQGGLFRVPDNECFTHSPSEATAPESGLGSRRPGASRVLLYPSPGLREREVRLLMINSREYCLPAVDTGAAPTQAKSPVNGLSYTATELREYGLDQSAQEWSDRSNTRHTMQSLVNVRLAHCGSLWSGGHSGTPHSTLSRTSFHTRIDV